LTWRALFCLGIALPTVTFWSAAALAQELAPRAYWPTPKGTNVLTIGYQYSTGDTLTDPSLPIIGVNSSINLAQLSYQHTFGLWQRTATLQFNLPYTWGTTQGFAEGEFRNGSVSGMSDARVRLSVNLLGAPSMDAAGFQALRAKPRTIIGASLLVQLPTGKYESDKLINAGTNRWAMKPALGVIWPVRPTWLVEFDLGVWLLGDNDEFLGVTREQNPILSTELHIVKRFRPGFWASLDANYYVGGRTTVDQIERADLQRNSRIGGTILFPFKRQHAIRASYSTGITTESGGDFEIFSLSYLYAW
jgi:hypothetical protein